MFLSQTALANLRIHDERRQLLVGLGRDQFHDRRIGVLAAAGEHVVPALEGGVLHHLGIAGLDFVDDAHCVRVVRHRDPIERFAELHGLATGRNDLFAAGEPHRFFRAERRAAAAAIRRPGGVHVLIAEIDALRIIAAGVRRIARRLVELARISRRDLSRIRVHRRSGLRRWGAQDFGRSGCCR